MVIEMGLEVVELIMRIEEEFDIEIPDKDAERLTTVGHIADYVSERSQVSLRRHSEIWERVRAIVIDELAVPENKVMRDARLVEDLDLD